MPPLKLPRYRDLRALRVRNDNRARGGGESVAFLVDENRNPWLCGKDTPRYILIGDTLDIAPFLLVPE